MPTRTQPQTSSIVEVSSKIATAVDESLSKQQKALFLRQQFAPYRAAMSRDRKYRPA
ncbi:hypothetical protein EDB92DRAFT_1876621 [Lactarius akahatsu]|uniref:Uncharacterized protein n=1 Tax=Lactarius akahatsu TaxID=416441 RepID=A0AAD4LH80_9AGAM|nr:hypothetical protein EDB92DRAFT_1876621 [Lactarius akahatsu]